MDDMHSRLRSARDGMRANGYAAGADYLADALSIIDGLQCEVKALQQDAVQHALNSRRLLERIAELEGQNVGQPRPGGQ
jgi:hypothetical protein